jgi:hypothetical protein
MSPPSPDQLINDYLSRLSAAARGWLDPEDRRALVNRTRDFIDRKANMAGPPTAIEAASLLASLGDPAGLVRQERERLAPIRGELPDPAGRRSRLARALRRDPGKVRKASWHWPVLESGRTDLQIRLIDSGDVDDDASARGPSAAEDSVSNGRSGAERNGRIGAGRNGTAPEATMAQTDGQPGDSPIYVPAQAREPSWFLLALGGEPQEYDWPSDAAPSDAVPSGSEEPYNSQPDDPEPDDVPSDGVLSGEVLAAGGTGAAGGAVTTPAWQLTTAPDPVIPRLLRRGVRAVGSWYRRTPLEATAVTLLGLGVIFPPIWLLGAALALPSRFWDYLDKWAGLALPLVITIIGIAVGIVTSGHVSMGHSMHEAWVYGVVASRIAALLSGCFLGWRTARGRRPPTVPPWNRPHKIGL